MRILGIDPGTRNVGWGIIEEKGNSLHCIASGTIKTKGDDLACRLVEIYRGLRAAIEEHSPQEAAVETVFAGKNIKTAIAIGEGRGVALLAAAESGLPVRGYEPTVVKKAITSSGRAGKEQVMQVVKILLALPKLPDSDHEADALAMAITHSRRRGVENMAGLNMPTRSSGGQRKKVSSKVMKASR